MILCWNVGQESFIYNYFNLYCFMKILEGVVYEEFYKKLDMMLCQCLCGCKMEKIDDRDYVIDNVVLIIGIFFMNFKML